MERLTDVIAPSFYDLYYDVTENAHTHYWLKGGRGSTKSSFVSVMIILGIMNDAAANAVVIRKVSQSRNCAGTDLRYAPRKKALTA